MEITPIIAILGFFGTAFGIVYMAISSHHKSKMAMIEAGLDPRSEEEKGFKDPGKTLKYAILLIMVPIGILTGRAAGPAFDLLPEQGGLLFAFLFGGIGLGIFYLIQRNREIKSGK